MNTSARSALEMRQICKVYGAVNALTGVDFVVEHGKVRGLLGHNGAGKSTLMKIAAGVTKPSAGQVFIADKELSVARPTIAREMGLRIVHQELSLVPTLSVADNIFLQEEHLRAGVFVSRRRQVAEVGDTFDQLGIRIRPTAKVADLTRAEREMVEIARAIRDSSAVLILDEPTAPLSRPEIERLFEVIRRAASGGTGIVLVTHHISEVFEICDYVSVLRDGSSVLDAATGNTSMGEVIEAISGQIGNRNGAIAMPPPAPRADEAVCPDREDEQYPVLAVQGLQVSGKLQDVSFTLRSGEILGVAGLAGSGRSVLLKALVGTVPSTSKTIDIHGQPYRPRDSAYGISRGLFRVPEDRRVEGLLLDHSIALNIVLGRLDFTRRAFLYSTRSVSRSANELVQRLGIRCRSIHDPTGDLSGGNQQKVLLARAFFSKCRALLLDEPTFGVDVGAATDIVRFIREYVAAGNGVLWVSSDLNELGRVADRVLVIRNGMVVEILDNADHTLNEADLVEVLEENVMQSQPGPIKGPELPNGIQHEAKW